MFRGMPTGPDAFLGNPGVSGLRPCTRTHLARLVGRTTNKLATLIDGDSKAPYSIATTPRYSGMALLHSLDGSTLPLILTLLC